VERTPLSRGPWGARRKLPGYQFPRAPQSSSCQSHGGFWRHAQPQLPPQPGSGEQLLQVDVLCGAGVLQVLLVILQEGAAHTLGHRPHGLLGDKDVAGKAAQQRVFGDEAKIAAGGLMWRGIRAQTHTLAPPLPRDLETSVRNRGLGKRVRDEKNVWVTRIQDLKVPFWVLVQAQC